jgi:hypothetical protein
MEIRWSGGRQRLLAEPVPVDGRRVVVKLRARRMRCPVLGVLASRHAPAAGAAEGPPSPLAVPRVLGIDDPLPDEEVAELDKIGH